VAYSAIFVEELKDKEKRKGKVREMLKATVNTGLIKKAIRSSNAFLNETKARIDEEGIAIKAVDAGNVCLADIFIPKEDFESVLNLKAETIVEGRQFKKPFQWHLRC